VRAERSVTQRAAVVGPSVPGASGLRRLLAADDRTTHWAAGFAAAVVAFAGLYLAGALNIWIDEAFTLRTTDAGLIAAWERALGFELQPPVYFVIEALWRMFDEGSVVFARLPSVAFAAGAAAVVVLAARRIAPRVPPAVVAALTALNPVFVWAASELRVYALVLLIGAALTWLFFEGFLVAPAARRAQLCYTALALGGLYTQYYVGFVLAVHLLTLLALRRGTLRAFVASMVVVALGFAPFLRVALTHAAASGPFVSHTTFAHAAHEVANVAFAFVLPHNIMWSGALKIGGFALAAALVTGVCVFGRPNLRGNPGAGIVLQWALCLVVFGALFGFSGVPIDPMRHLVIVAPSSVLATCVLLSSLTRERVRIVALMGTVFTLFAVGTFWSAYRPPLAKKGDWQRVAAVLARSDPATPVAIFPAELALPLRVYLPKATIPIPRDMPYSGDYVRATTLSGVSEVARVLDPVRAAADRLWLVTGVACGNARLSGDNYNYNCRFLEEYMQQKYRLVESIAFDGSVARLYERGAAARTGQPKRRHAN
jgi:hypothetical protein